MPGADAIMHPPSPSDERPSSRFRGISSPTVRPSARYSTVGLTRYRTRRTGSVWQGTVSR
ncbi:hypothetical protein CSM73_004155 [Salmonella enterica subsp. diarizonae]|uniref:Uncharacterized protein n=1 Tax=Salmonella enterica I TaxID=59201 RepID=A0A3R0YJH0_SALET|nr:hypothetical protein [Salmonella enterica subsp. diarizonae]EED9398005.1 hypothetical protein [Salmonella enterica subsp. enterica serovar Oranienburg]MLV00002.1 hypothetical protein [Salmonella enterica subsp. enterica serovar Oranienburg]